LVVKGMSVGKYSGTSVTLMYIEGIVSKKVVDEVQKKLEAIDIDGVIDSFYIASCISPDKHSMFRQVGNSEKPDVIASKILEGRVAIIVDGSPIVLTVPYMLAEDFQDGGDYYMGAWRSSMSRIFRLLGVMISILLPAVYVALQSYHYHLLPLKFLLTLITATNGISFPPEIEMLFVLILFEILSEASVRMPSFMGISLSIVGAIVLGDTAVKAGLISSPAVLVTALSAIGVYCVPDQSGTITILRMFFLLVSSVFGFFGIILCSILLVARLASMDTFGTPYLAPYAPRINPDLKDGFLKADLGQMKTRPYSIPNVNHTRQSSQEEN
jgi:spore germination protein KA